LLGGAGTVAKTLCETAAAHDVETVYVGSRGLSAASRLFLGSVSMATLNRCNCNVTVVKDRVLANAEAAAAAERLSQDAPLPIV
jgi:nucleotide-binding universal stress UspA family protein